MRSADRIALFFDFDGTLEPIAPWPDRVWLVPRKRKLLESIARKDVPIGVVSGRMLPDLRKRVAAKGIWYVGVHGYFFRRSGGLVHTVLSPSQRTEMRAISRRLVREMQGVRGVLVEYKQATTAIHYRHASGKGYRRVFAAICALLRDYPHLYLLPGKKVWEIFPDSHVNKWTAIQHILRLEEENHNRRTLIFYLGDDLIDERVFSEMNGISVVVGKRRRSAAKYFLKSPGEVGEFLRLVSEAVK